MTDQPQSITSALGVIATLVAAGVRHVVTCPGSRNAPLLYAAAAAEANGALTLHPRSDERVAAFHALGLSLGDDRRPVAVIVTSGTAVANLHPAVLEAAHAGVPLIAITADRPQELQRTGANQTAEQDGIFEPALSSVTLHAADGADGAFDMAVGVVGREIAAAVGIANQLRPVHLNVELRDPLVPVVPGEQAVLPVVPEDSAVPPLPFESTNPLVFVLPTEPSGEPTEPSGEPTVPPGESALPFAADDPTSDFRAASNPAHPNTSDDDLPTHLGDPLTTLTAAMPDAIASASRTFASLLDAVTSADAGQLEQPSQSDGYTAELLSQLPHPLDVDRTIVVAGHDAGLLAGALATVTGWPLIGEVTSNCGEAPYRILRYRDAIAMQLREVLPVVEQVIVIGRPTLSRESIQLLSRPDTRLISVRQQFGGVDSWANPGFRAVQKLDEVPSSWLEPRPISMARMEFARAWSEAGRPTSEPRIVRFDAHGVAQTITKLSREDDVLVVGPSGPVRHLDAQNLPMRSRVLANRGLSGIDGVLSTAIGVAEVWRSGTVRAFVGDLTFLHDLNALQIGGGEDEPQLQIIVVNDDGGTIFSGLEHGAVAHTSDHAGRVVKRLLTTPPRANIAQLCAGFAVRHLQVTSLDMLAQAVQVPSGGLEVVEVLLNGSSSTS